MIDVKDMSVLVCNVLLTVSDTRTMIERSTPLLPLKLQSALPSMLEGYTTP